MFSDLRPFIRTRTVLDKVPHESSGGLTVGQLRYAEKRESVARLNFTVSIGPNDLPALSLFWIGIRLGFGA
jgi:hypothetical protein